MTQFNRIRPTSIEQELVKDVHIQLDGLCIRCDKNHSGSDLCPITDYVWLNSDRRKAIHAMSVRGIVDYIRKDRVRKVLDGKAV